MQFLRRAVPYLNGLPSLNDLCRAISSHIPKNYVLDNTVLWLRGKYLSIYAAALGVASGIGSISLLFESKGRQSDIALYVTTKTLEIVHGYLKKHQLITTEIPYFTVWVFGAVMAIYGYYYQNEPSSIKHTFLSALTKVLGAI